MAVIWGLDLHEIQWAKFKNSYMWNTKYHQRRTKFIIYQLAMILCVVSESLGTAALSDYVDQQKFVANQNPNATVHNNDYVGIASYNIFVGVFIATIFGAAFFFDLFWPERHESASVKLAWKACAVLSCVLALADALAYTYIVAAKSAYVTGTNAAETQRLLAAYGGSPMAYRHNGRAVASVVFLWPGWVFTVVSTYLLWHSIDHIDQYGPFSTHARTRQDIGKPVIEKPVENGSPATASSLMEATVAPHEPAHATQEGFHDRNAGANGEQYSSV